MVRPASVRRSLTAVLSLASVAVLACSSGAGDEDVGQASAAISGVPAQVSCIEVDVTGTRSVTNRFSVTAGQSSVLSLTGLPLGADTFVGLAYSVACASVTSATQATWASAPVTASLVSQQVASVSLTLRPNGESTVNVGFVGDDAGTTDAAVDSSTATCAAGFTLCSGTCVNETADPSNCGACGNACIAPDATAACSAGVCAIAACAAGFADCDHNFGDGCETNTATSVTSCGGCNVVCSTANATPACTSGVCRIAECNAGFYDCDGIASNGCEVNGLTSPTNCGACGHVCSGTTPTCTAGVCH